MPKIVPRARQLRWEYQQKLGRTVTMQEVASAVGVTRTALNLIELGQTERIDFDTLAKLCSFYSTVLGRPIGVGDVLEFKPEDRRMPSLVAA